MMGFFTVLCPFPSDLVLEKPAEQYVFGGGPASVQLTIRNLGPPKEFSRLTHRLYQASSATIAPVEPAREFPPRVLGDGIFSLEFSPPAVRTITGFIVKVFDEGSEIGAVPVHVCPTNLFQNVSNLAKHVAIFDSERHLPELLEKHGVEFQNLLESGAGEAELLLVKLTSAKDEEIWRARRIAPQVPTAYIVGWGVTSSEKILPVKFSNAHGHPSVIVQDWFVPNLNVSAGSQVRLLHTLELLLKPELVKLPEPDKPSN